MAKVSWLPVELPHGLGDNYVLPQSLRLTALFSSYDFSRVKRPLVDSPVELAAYGRTRVLQISGYHLDQPDADVFMQLVALSIPCNPVQVGVFRLVGFQVERNELLRLLGRTEQGAGDKRWLQQSLDRLVGARFRFDQPESDDEDTDSNDNDTWRTGLIHEWAFVGKKSIQVLLNHNLARLYADNAWSLINRQQRQALSGNKMAQWLHSFYSGFRLPAPILAQALRKPLARSQMRDDKYLDALQVALVALAGATGWGCELTGGKVIVKKRGAPAAQKITVRAVNESSSKAWVQQLSRTDLTTLLFALDIRLLTSDSLDRMRDMVCALCDEGLTLDAAKTALSKYSESNDI